MASEAFACMQGADVVRTRLFGLLGQPRPRDETNKLFAEHSKSIIVVRLTVHSSYTGKSSVPMLPDTFPCNHIVLILKGFPASLAQPARAAVHLLLHGYPFVCACTSGAYSV